VDWSKSASWQSSRFGPDIFVPALIRRVEISAGFDGREFGTLHLMIDQRGFLFHRPQREAGDGR
jgi:hypothetical protein